MEFTIDEANVKKRLDVFLAENLENVTRSYIKTLLENENIKVNGSLKKAGYLLRLGDKIFVTFPEDKLSQIEAENIPLEIVYEDEDIMIINKPKGMVVHPANGNYTGTVVNSLLYSHKENLSSIGLYLNIGKYPLIVAFFSSSILEDIPFNIPWAIHGAYAITMEGPL